MGADRGEGPILIRGPNFVVVGLAFSPEAGKIREIVDMESPQEIVSALPEEEDGAIEEVSRMMNIPFRRVSLSGAEILDLFADNVPFLDLLRLNRRRRKLAKIMEKRPMDVVEQERFLRKVRGYRRFEEARERIIVDRIGRPSVRTMVFVDAELAEGVASGLRERFNTGRALPPEGL